MRFSYSSCHVLGLVSLLTASALAQDTSETSSATSTSTSIESPSVSPSSLPDTASENGGGRWGAAIENELPPRPSGRRTAFVPVDESFPARLVRQDGIDVEQYLYQVTDQYLTAADLRASMGVVVETLDTDANLGGRGQAVLSHGRRENASIEVNVTSTAPVRLYSGLGDNVTIVQEDIPFDGGILHIISGPFTRPAVLSASLDIIGNASNFSSHISSHLDALDTTPSITVFAPANDALSTLLGANTTLSPSEVTALVDGHVIAGTVAYSPLLTRGATFQTLDGEEVTVTDDSDGEIMLNGSVRVIQSDIVIANGVVHLIDQALSSPTGTAAGPTPTTSGENPIFTGAAVRSSKMPSSASLVLFGLVMSALGYTAQV
ncbi:FAS1 domain-containing protein [Aspergillus oleicola]